jgi:acetyltransferase-like isoleucine patch superfamily enzyme
MAGNLRSNYFVHPLSICESDQIGFSTKIWAFSHVQYDVKIGDDCNIGECVFIETGASIGNKVTIKNGVQIWKGVTIQDEVFIGPNVTFTNDKYPVSKNFNFSLLETLVMRGASIGANATILPGIKIGFNSVVGAGAVVTKDVQNDTTVVGNPATLI